MVPTIITLVWADETETSRQGFWLDFEVTHFPRAFKQTGLLVTDSRTFLPLQLPICCWCPYLLLNRGRLKQTLRSTPPPPFPHPFITTPAPPFTVSFLIGVPYPLYLCLFLLPRQACVRGQVGIVWCPSYPYQAEQVGGLGDRLFWWWYSSMSQPTKTIPLLPKDDKWPGSFFVNIDHSLTSTQYVCVVCIL